MTRLMPTLTAPALFLFLFSAAGCGSSSGAGSSGAPVAPSELKASELEGGAHLTWKDNSDNEAGFMIERMVGSGPYMTLANVPFNTTQYHDPNLTAGTTYMYHVMAMGKTAGKDSDFSNEVTMTIGADAGAGH